MASIRKAALVVLLASPLAAGCMPSSPRTVFEWDVNDRAPRMAYHPRPARQVAHAGSRTYVYREAATPVPTPRPDPRFSTARVESGVLPSPRPASYPIASIDFAWPVTGPVIADFGSTANGGKNDGINIATAMDAPIRASASGTVTYAGDDLKAYGNLVLIKHSDGYTTAYAHADRLLVQRGDFVAKGQVIAYAGQTGDVTRPQLHFEIRANTTPVNPRAYLTTQQARS